MKLYTIDTGLFKLDGGAMHGVVPKALWNKINPADDRNLCTWAMRCLLIEHGNHLILIDTGIGDKQDEKFFSHYYLQDTVPLAKAIAAFGYTPADVTDVLLTHLHFDHVGGAVSRQGDRLFPTFPKAKYWSNKAHWEWAVHPNDREKASFLKENILPLQESGQLAWVEVEDGEEWMPDIRIKYVNGHTEAMMLPLINYEQHTILYCADLLPSMGHLPLPWVMGYDMRPLDTLAEKKRILQQALADNWLLYFEHDPKVALCNLQQTEKGIRHKDIFTLDDL